MDQPRDRELVRRMLSGQEAAFEEFFQSYFPGLYRFVMRRLNQNAEAAEEIVLRALGKALLRISTYRGEASLYAWLSTFCRHEVGAYIKQHNRTAGQVSLLEDAPEVRAALESLYSACQDLPDQALLRKEVVSLVQSALDAIPSRYADVLEWKYIEGIQVKDIAERLNVGLKAAESLLSRARAAFREAFTTLTSGVMPAPVVYQGGETGE